MICPVTGADCLTCDETCSLSEKVGAGPVRRPTEEQAAAMVGSLSPEAYAAFKAIVPMIGTDSGRLVTALIEASCVTAMAAGIGAQQFTDAVIKMWNDRAREFSGGGRVN